MTDTIPGSPSWLTDESLDLALSDAFDVSGFVGRLSDLVEAGDPPFTISLSGSWGLGKSTVAEGLMARVKSRDIPAVLIDAWTEDVEHLRRTLVIAVGAELRGGAEHREAVADEIDDAVHLSRTETLPPKPELRLVELLRDMRKRPAVFAALVLFDAALLAGTLASAAWLPTVTGSLSTVLGASLVFTALQSGLFFRIETASQSRAPAHESVETAARFRGLMTTGGSSAPKKVLVVVDNLDRLQGADALKALAQIRALVEIKGSRAIFLIPIDRGALARHIEPSLGPNGGTDGSASAEPQAEGLAAKDYLEKFFNLDLLLTRPEVLDLRKWALGEARKVLPAGDETDLVTAAQVVASAGNGSPRSVKRIINGISARSRLIDRKFKPQPSLAQLAFVEGLLTQYPEVVGWLGRDPRDFISYRAGLSEASPSGDAPAPMSQSRERQLRSYLLANAEIELTAPLVRMMMSLRPDRVWQDVSDPGPLQEALDTGQPEEFRAAIEAIDPRDRPIAIRRSVVYVERSVPGFLRDAVNNLVAIGDVIADEPDAGRTLHPMAVQTFIATDDANRRRITRPLASYLFAAGYSRRQLGDLAWKFVASLAAGPSLATEALVWAVRQAGQQLSSDQVTAAREALKGLDDDLLAPLFEEPADRRLIDGPIASMYMARLIAWDSTADQGPVQTAIERIAAVAEAGWSAPDAVLQVAARATTQIPIMPDDDASNESLDGILSLLQSAPEGDEVDQLATALVAVPGTVKPAERMSWVLYLPVRPAARPGIERGLAGWLRRVKPDLAELLVIGHKEALATFGYDPTPVLTSRWIAGEGRRWAELAAEVNAGADPALLAKVLPATPDVAYAGPIAEAAGIAEARRDRPAAESLMADIAVRAVTLPPAVIGKIGETLASLRRTGADLTPVVAALENRIGTDSAVGPLTHSVRLLHDYGIKEMRQLAKPLAARGSAAGGVDLDDVEWLVRSSGGSADARRVLVRAIETEPVAKVCPIVDGLVDLLRKNRDIRFALVRRISTGADEADVNLLLESALPWKMPGPDQLDPYRQMLTQVATAWPNTTERINRLQ